MTTLRLREGWTAVTSGATTYIYPPGESTTGIRWYVDMDDDEIAAYPNGDRQAQVFDTVEEAHAYLLESGSESPWEVTP
jgi:hypothetical protein